MNPHSEEIDPDVPVPTDNTERPEDGEQDVSQDPSIDYSAVSE